jgi:two-component system, NtrC family, C4-dicarboxylate transport response regulator DctD
MTGDVTKIAIIDDEANIRSALRQIFELEQFEVIEFADGESALAAIQPSFTGIVISDLRMPGMDGNALFDRLYRMDPELPIIMISGHGDVATAVDLVRRGAYDFLTKPFAADSLISTVKRAFEKRALVMENRALRAAPTFKLADTILGDSAEIEQLRQTVKQLAQADIDVLLTGESGTGKSHITEILHRQSVRGRKPMITVDCGTLQAEHADSLLFGHVSGAFPGAQFPRTGQLLLANGTTLCLDHVDRLSPALQTRILHSLETRSVLPIGANQAHSSNFRTISATSSDIDGKLDNGAFDPSLYFRLASFRLEVPPLRARKGDVIVLFRAFLTEACAEMKRDVPILSQAIWRRLQDHDWPGNVRELRSFAANVALGLGYSDISVRSLDSGDHQSGLKEAVAEYEASLIRSMLEQQGGDVAATIATLQLPRKTFYDKLARHKIDPNDYRTRGHKIQNS